MSSLRSLFEDKSNTSSGPTTPSRPLARPELPQDDAQRSTRASLDIPRISSPWSASGAAFVPQSLGTTGPPVPRPRQHSSRALQRPVSTNSLSAPRSPPLVTIDLPSSPPNGPQLASMKQPLQMATAKSMKHVSISPQSPRMAPPPPNRAQPHTMASSPRRLVAESEKSNMSSQPALKSIDDSPVENIKRSLPPPVNRADKPRIPTKPVLVAGKVNLEPLVPAAGERVSPFSTPPSSDESI